jgi:hypothetical protein
VLLATSVSIVAISKRFMILSPVSQLALKTHHQGVSSDAVKEMFRTPPVIAPRKN